MSAYPQLTPAEDQLVADARALAPFLQAASDEIDAARQLPSHVVAALHQAGCFRMTLPLDEGGLAAGFLAQIRVIEEISAANGSAGWCVMIGSANNHFLTYIEPATAREMAPTPETVLAAALFRPAGLTASPAAIASVGDGPSPAGSRTPSGPGPAPTSSKTANPCIARTATR